MDVPILASVASIDSRDYLIGFTISLSFEENRSCLYRTRRIYLPKRNTSFLFLINNTLYLLFCVFSEQEELNRWTLQEGERSKDEVMLEKQRCAHLAPRPGQHLRKKISRRVFVISSKHRNTFLKIHSHMGRVLPFRNKHSQANNSTGPNIERGVIDLMLHILRLVPRGASLSSD